MKGVDALSKYYSIHEFSKIIGVSAQTLRNWDANGKLHPHHTTVSGYRYYSDEQLNQVINVKPKNRIAIGECRVSSHKQKHDLERQRDKGNAWLLNISNNVTKQAIKDACTAYKNFFKGLQKFPRFKSRKRSMPKFYQDNVKIQFSNTHVKFEGFSSSRKANKQKMNWVRLAEHGRIPTDVKYMNPRISFDGLNWWISVCVEFPNCKETLNDDGVGIDLGIKDLAVCSDAVKYKNINKSQKVKKLEKQKRRLQRSISRSYEKNKKGESYCKTNNVIKKEKLLLKRNHRLTNIRKNYLNQTISEIVNRKPRFICIEDLNVSGMMKNRHLSKAVQEQGFFWFRKQLEYKCNDKGIQLIVADRFYPSSKLCSCCGNIKKDLMLSDRVY